MTKKRLSVMAVVAIMISAFAGSAKADHWHDHEVQAHRYWHHPRPHGVVVEPAPVVYSPPVVYAPPPPPPEGINLILPIHIN